MRVSINSSILRTISILITICILPMPSQAKYGGGSGTADDPYQISTAEDLFSLGETPEDYDKHFILTADIDLDPNLPGRKVFNKAVIAPIVNSASDVLGAVFTGSFNGNEYTISHLTIVSNTNYLGLFGEIGSVGRIHNLHLDDIYVSSSGYCVCGLVGYNRGSITNCRLSGIVSGGAGESCASLALLAGRNRGNIMNCSVNGSVSNGSAWHGHYFGLLVGANLGKISHCSTNGTVIAGKFFSEIGGLVGDNRGSIADCHTSGNLFINSIYAMADDYGGLVGSNRGVINRCYATGDISFGKYSKYIGGLVGYNSGSIINCYASGDVSGTYSNWHLGGLVGWNWGNIVHCYAKGDVTGDGDVGGLVGLNWGTISHAYATGWIIGSELSYVDKGGLVGDGYLNKVSNSYWDIETSGQTTSEGGEGLSTAQMQDPLTFLGAGWDFVGERTNGTSGIWQMPKGGGYPELTFFSDGYQRQELAGSGISDDPYLIATAEDIGAILHNDYRACYRLMADIDLTGITWTTAVIPIFDGRFDGNGFTISNLTIIGGEYLAFFGVLDKHAIVENLGIKDANIVGGSSASDLGILAVENWGLIANCQVTGNVSGGQYEEHLGGMVRYNIGTIINCDPIDYDGPYSVIITDPEATREFLSFEGVDFDQVWIPGEGDIEGLDSILKAFLESDKPAQENTWLDCEYILDNWPRYDKEYSGFILNDSKYVICQMICWSGFQGSCYIAEYDPGNIFTIIYDGGCGVVRVIYDAESKAVVSISCNGM